MLAEVAAVVIGVLLFQVWVEAPGGGEHEFLLERLHVLVPSEASLACG